MLDVRPFSNPEVKAERRQNGAGSCVLIMDTGEGEHMFLFGTVCEQVG
jgi:hypothetical protein